MTDKAKPTVGKATLIDVWEAIVNGNRNDTYDPVVKITIHTAAHSYDFEPGELHSVTLRKFKRIVEK